MTLLLRLPELEQHVEIHVINKPLLHANSTANHAAWGLMKVGVRLLEHTGLSLH